MKFGYARVLTKDQNMETQLDALAIAGCDKIVTERSAVMTAKKDQNLIAWWRT